MNRHPIPQDIMSVEFKLFGELTIKQFLYVGGGAILAYLAFASEMPLVIKLVLAILFGGGGAALALLPVNNRPLEVWIGNFLVAMFSPTKRVWKKGENPNFPKPSTATPQMTMQSNIAAVTKSQPASQITQYAPQTQPVRPVQPAVMQTTSQLISTDTTMSQQAPISPAPQASNSLPSPVNNMTMGAPMANNNDGKNLEQVITTSQTTKSPRQTFILDLTKLQDHSATLPSYQAKPNVVKGIVKDKTGSLVAGAVVIIKRKENSQPARAMVTNPLGEFETSTSLEKGTYLIDISHGEKEMPLYELTLDSAPVPPMQFQFTA